MVVTFRLILDAGRSRDMPIMGGNMSRVSMKDVMGQQSILGLVTGGVGVVCHFLCSILSSNIPSYSVVRY